MAIAVKLDQETKRTSVLDISADQYYTDKLRPFMQEVLIKCKTDPEIQRSVDKITNACDSFMKDGSAQALRDASDVIDPTLKVITGDTYYRDGALKRAMDEEVKMVRDLATKLTDFAMLLKIEIDHAQPAEEAPAKERIDYSTPHGASTGENTDWHERNMKTLNEPHPKDRLPNV